MGITGVPFFVLNRRYGISGAQPAEMFSEALAHAIQESEPGTPPAQAG
jgi:predicted DsbA family dithiol-disulfide isomerase